MLPDKGVPSLVKAHCESTVKPQTNQPNYQSVLTAINSRIPSVVVVHVFEKRTLQDTCVGFLQACATVKETAPGHHFQ